MSGSTASFHPAVERSAEEREQTRWMVWLGTPFLAACGFVALTFATGLDWMLAPAIILGPGLCILLLVYLAMSSDTLGATAPAEPARHGAKPEPVHAAGIVAPAYEPAG
jgi:hypothetical protein